MSQGAKTRVAKLEERIDQLEAEHAHMLRLLSFFGGVMKDTANTELAAKWAATSGVLGKSAGLLVENAITLYRCERPTEA
jgi:hypothetical protein